MSTLKIQITKRRDGSAVLRCERADGSTTWQKQAGRQAAFFPLHDLIHFAVEQELGYTEAFFGLIARGWDIEDTTGKGARGSLPPEAVAAELIVGLLMSESASGVEWSAEEFKEQAALYAASRGAAVSFDLTDEQLERIRTAARALHERWGMVPPGGVLELEFRRD